MNDTTRTHDHQCLYCHRTFDCVRRRCDGLAFDACPECRRDDLTGTSTPDEFAWVR